ncbi:MAG: hypothetical protein JWN56_2152 [Sphingobacteriales bacterium]|nr:hypothetical protein [Sphingobacteriales bacterium]
MNRKFLSILFFTGLGGLSGTVTYAQKPNPDVDANMWMQHPVVVDGNSEEWHEPLNNFNSETKLAFALGNDEQNLYLVIESLDEVTTGRLIRGGLTLNINTAGKKKDGIKLNFLGMKQPPPPHGELKDSTFHHTEKKEHDPGVRVISVSGFKNIADGSLAMPNDAGIQVAAAFNQRKDYICELAIPLAQLNLNGKEAKGIAYQIKINSAGGNPEHRHEGGQGVEGGGMSRGGGMGGGMHGGGGHGGGAGGGGGGRKGSGGGMESRKSDQGSGNSSKSDFWIKYELAKPSESFKIN